MGALKEWFKEVKDVHGDIVRTRRGERPLGDYPDDSFFIGYFAGQSFDVGAGDHPTGHNLDMGGTGENILADIVGAVISYLLLSIIVSAGKAGMRGIDNWIKALGYVNKRRRTERQLRRG